MRATLASPQEVLSSIQDWQHWKEIQLGAEKEYALSKEEFDRLLPEYQKFMGLIALGYHELGMFSNEVDKLWHTHILNTVLYEQFCIQIFGSFIHHAPNLQRKGISDTICTDQCAAGCTTCKRPTPSCSETCKKPVPPDDLLREHTTSTTTVEQFHRAYTSAYGAIPQNIWNLPEIDGVTIVS